MPVPTMIIRLGDILKRDKGLHEQVEVARFGGRVPHNSPFRGEYLSSIDEFAAGRPGHGRPTPAARRECVLANGMKVLQAPHRILCGAIIVNTRPITWCSGVRRDRSSGPGRWSP